MTTIDYEYDELIQRLRSSWDKAEPSDCKIFADSMSAIIELILRVKKVENKNHPSWWPKNPEHDLYYKDGNKKCVR